MGLYRKKPVTIEAKNFSHEGHGNGIAFWCGGVFGYDAKPSDKEDIAYWIDIPTMEGVMRANLGDWVIKGVKGEFYPCKPDIFEATYEKVL